MAKAPQQELDSIPSLSIEMSRLCHLYVYQILASVI
jgi:hypothetical protein